MTDDLRALIRDIPDFPKPGIVFKDITPLMADSAALAQAVGSASPSMRCRCGPNVYWPLRHAVFCSVPLWR